MSLADAIRHGTTTLFDHHASAGYVDGSLDVIADAVEQSGVRGVLCYEVTDRHGAAAADAGIKENLRFMRRLEMDPNPRLAAMFGLHASLTLSGATLQACRAAAPSEAAFHIHVAEHEQDQYDSLAKSKMRVVERLQNHGILGPRTIAAHCVHVDAAEIALLKSDAHLGYPPAPIQHEQRSRSSTGGIDAAGRSPRVPRQRWLPGLHVAGVEGRSLPAQVLESGSEAHGCSIRSWTWPWASAPKLPATFFPGQPIGQITPGAAADLILVDYPAPTPITSENFPWHVLFGLQSGMVTTTIVAGKILMKDRQLTTLDEAALSARARELAPRVWRRFEETQPTMTPDAQLPVVAVIGGSGKEGKGLAYRFAKAGYPVIIGSRSVERARLGRPGTPAVDAPHGERAGRHEHRGGAAGRHRCHHRTERCPRRRSWNPSRPRCWAGC